MAMTELKYSATLGSEGSSGTVFDAIFFSLLSLDVETDADAEDGLDVMEGLLSGLVLSSMERGLAIGKSSNDSTVKCSFSDDDDDDDGGKKSLFAETGRAAAAAASANGNFGVTSSRGNSARLINERVGIVVTTGTGEAVAGGGEATVLVEELRLEGGERFGDVLEGRKTELEAEAAT